MPPKDKPDPNDLEIAALKTLIQVLLRNLREVVASAEASRALLVAHHVFSADEHASAYSEALKLWDQSLATLIQGNEEAAKAAAYLRLLEKHEGPQQ